MSNDTNATQEGTTAEKLETSIVAIGNHAWGKGATVSEALKNWRAEAPSGKAKVYFYRVVGFTRVSEMGGICYKADGGSVEKIDEREVTRR